MQWSSTSRPRRLIVEKIRFLNSEYGLVDARYEIDNPRGSVRKMSARSSSIVKVSAG